jgi:thiol-disulfide isomerase/thioredoxin
MHKSPVVLCLLLGLSLQPGLAADSPAEGFHTLRIGNELPMVDFELVDGVRISRQDLLGKFLVIDFWATWCAPCIASFPTLNRLESAFADRPIAFYSVTYESPSKIQPVLDQHPLETTIGFDNDFATFSAFKAWGIPAIYIFNPEGRLVSALHPEDLTEQVLEEVLSGGIPDLEQSRGWPDPEGAEEYFRSLVD